MMRLESIYRLQGIHVWRVNLWTLLACAACMGRARWMWVDVTSGLKRPLPSGAQGRELLRAELSKLVSVPGGTAPVLSGAWGASQ